MVWEPKHGCGCCLTPKTATRLIGWLGVIGAFCGIVSSTIMLPYIADYCSSIDEPHAMHDRAEELCSEKMTGGVYSTVVEEIIRGSVCALLLLGIEKRQSCLMLPYMILNLFGVLAIVVGFTCLVGLSLVMGNMGLAFLCLVCGILLSFIGAYFLLVVRVCYMEVKTPEMTVISGTELVYLQNQEPSLSVKNIQGTPYATTALQGTPYPASDLQGTPYPAPALQGTSYPAPALQGNPCVAPAYGDAPPAYSV